jgi:hypothetical protein
MPQKLPDKYTDPERYAEAQAQRMRHARLRRERYELSRRRVWAAECARPIGQRRYFSCAGTAEGLACDPYTLTTDSEIRERIAGELTAWVQNRQFATEEVVTLSGNPPDFRPLKQLKPGAILVPHVEDLFLQPAACRRYIEARAELPGASRLLRDWFAADAAEPNVGDAGKQQPLLYGQALDDALDGWARRQWGNDMTKLPARAELLSLARTNPEFKKVNQDDIRRLRRRNAPDEIKKGGGGMHRHPKTGNMN